MGIHDVGGGDPSFVRFDRPVGNGRPPGQVPSAVFVIVTLLSGPVVVRVGGQPTLTRPGSLRPAEAWRAG